MTQVTFIGSADVIPEVGGETACFVINERVLVDCGWNAALEMRRYGLSPLELDALILTHCHHDHVMGLPGLLFYRNMSSRRAGFDPQPLHIYGPAGEIEEVVEKARQFLRADRFPDIWIAPELHPLHPGDTAETGSFRFRVERTHHGVPGLAYRWEDKRTGSILAFTGDTGFKPDLAELVEGADLLIHEAFFPPDRPAKEGDTHCSPADAARLAQSAGAKRLALIHYRPENGPAWLEAARNIFPETILALEGLTVNLAAESES